jgi:hypothetical protein
MIATAIGSPLAAVLSFEEGYGRELSLAHPTRRGRHRRGAGDDRSPAGCLRSRRCLSGLGRLGHGRAARARGGSL